MKPFTDTTRQWLWFTALVCGSLFFVALIAALTRWVVRLG